MTFAGADPPALGAHDLREPRRVVVGQGMSQLGGRDSGWIALGLGVVFFLLRCTRYDLAVATGITEFVLQLKFVAAPDLLVGHYVRDSVLGMMSPATLALAHLASAWQVDAMLMEYLRLFLLNLLAATAIWALSFTLFEDGVTSVLAVVVVVGGGLGRLGLGFDWKLGEFAEWHYFGLVTGLFVMTALYQGRWILASVLVGALASIHPSHALISGAMVLAVYVAQGRRLRPKEMAICLGAAALAAVPALLLHASTLRTLIDPGLEPTRWWEFMRARKSHHLFPFAWSWRLWLAASVLVVGGLAATSVVDRAAAREEKFSGRRRTTPVLLGVLAALFLTGVVFSELVPRILPTKLALFRVSNYAEILLVLYLCALVRASIASARVHDVGLGSAFIVASLWVDVFPLPSMATIGVAAAGIVLSPVPARAHATSGRRWATFAVSIGLITLAHVYVQALPRLSSEAPWDVTGARYWKDVQLWARSHTVPGAVFVNPPYWCGFEVFSERPATMSICDVGRSIYSTDTAAEEIRRVRAYGEAFGVEPRLSVLYFNGLERIYEAGDARDLRRLGALFGAEYAIVPAPSALSLSRVYENPRFVVYRLAE